MSDEIEVKTKGTQMSACYFMLHMYVDIVVTVFQLQKVANTCT